MCNKCIIKMTLKNLVEIYTELFTDDVLTGMCFKIKEGKNGHGA